MSQNKLVMKKKTSYLDSVKPLSSMKSSSFIAFFFFTFQFCMSCSEPQVEPPAYNDEIVVSKLAKTNNGKPYIWVDGKPFLMLGAQLRTDYFIQLEGKSLEELDEYFRLARSLNITCVQVPISWKDIEPKKDQYSNKFPCKFIELCNKYDMKLEILWYGSYMCGYSVQGYIPDYVIFNEATYPSYNLGKSYQGWLGKQYWLKPDNEVLIERESKALACMMDAIWEYDRNSGGHRTVIGIQIENEPDMLATRHTLPGQPLQGISAETIWPGLINLLDKLGQVVKDSKYKCYTRVNMTNTYTDYVARSSEVAATKGIDFVGVDPYQNTISQIKTSINYYSTIEDNFSHIAENGGEFENNDILELLSFTMGAGYEVFEVVTTKSPLLADWTLRGVYHTDFSRKAQTQKLIDANNIYRNAWVDLAIADNKNIVGFNLSTNTGLVTTKELKSTDHVSIQWSTTERGIAFAIERDGYLTVASTKADKMVFSQAQLSNPEIGHYDSNGIWIKQNSADLGNELIMTPGYIYRMKIVN
ncbi:MAG: DUF4978 domain-containing protein [Bacteroidales bacterium]|nr:DUF4978 domain-containing protein [Bacteroidales bacterium]